MVVVGNDYLSDVLSFGHAEALVVDSVVGYVADASADYVEAFACVFGIASEVNGESSTVAIERSGRVNRIYVSAFFAQSHVKQLVHSRSGEHIVQQR